MVKRAVAIHVECGVHVGVRLENPERLIRNEIPQRIENQTTHQQPRHVSPARCESVEEQNERKYYKPLAARERHKAQHNATQYEALLQRHAQVINQKQGANHFGECGNAIARHYGQPQHD